jgi:hypothetical protein
MSGSTPPPPYAFMTWVDFNSTISLLKVALVSNFANQSQACMELCVIRIGNRRWEIIHSVTGIFIQWNGKRNGITFT